MPLCIMPIPRRTNYSQNSTPGDVGVGSQNSRKPPSVHFEPKLLVNINFLSYKKDCLLFPWCDSLWVCLCSNLRVCTLSLNFILHINSECSMTFLCAFLNSFSHQDQGPIWPQQLLESHFSGRPGSFFWAPLI